MENQESVGRSLRLDFLVLLRQGKRTENNYLPTSWPKQPLRGSPLDRVSALFQEKRTYKKNILRFFPFLASAMKKMNLD